MFNWEMLSGDIYLSKVHDDKFADSQTILYLKKIVLILVYLLH